MDIMSDLGQIALELRAALDADSRTETRVRAEWAESKLRLIEVLTRARNKFDDNSAFSFWLARNELDDPRVSHQDRAAAISLGGNLALARIALTETNSWSLQLIWREWQPRYNDKVSVTSTSNRNNPDPPAPDKPPLPPNTPLVKKFGADAARIINAHFDRRTRSTARIAERLNKAQAQMLAEFLRVTPNLPKPSNSDQRLGLRHLWAQAPNGLCRKYEFNLGEGDAIERIIEDWPSIIAPVFEQWIADGSPNDSTKWYMRIAPPVAAAPVAVTEERRNSIEASVAAMVAESARLRPDPSCRASFVGTISHHGVIIWSAGTTHHYSFEEAWFVATIWRSIDVALRRAEPNPRARVALFFKPFIGCVRNLTPAGGEALATMLYAQDGHPEKTAPEDNLCPPYDSIQ